MSELKKNFVQGKMNKDYDVRLIPEGEYIDAFNVLVSNSEDSQVGSVQNSYGIDKLSTLSIPSDAETIGSSSDEGNECIYWFVASSTGNYIFEYDQLNSGLISTVLEDTRVGSDNVLNFSKQYKITGVNVIYNSFNKQKLLVWTDDLNGIRCINIKRAKGYGASSPGNNTFLSQDISLYKRQPHFAPICTPTTTGDGTENNIKERFLSFGYRWKYLDGEYSSVSTFSNPQFYPGKFHLDYTTNENLGMINKFNAVNVQFFTGDKNVTDVQLVFKESNSNNIWIIDTFNKKKLGWGPNAPTIPQSFLFSNNKIYSVLPEDEVNRLFDNVPIVAKAQDFIGNRLIYGNYVEGRDLVDANNQPINIDYNLTFKSEGLADIAIPSTITTFDTLQIDFTGVQIKKGEVLTISFRATSPYTFFGNYLFESSLFLENDYSNALALQVSSEFNNFIVNVCSSNFENYDTSSTVPPTNLETTYIPFSILPNTDITKISIKIPSIKYKVSATPTYVYEIFSIYSDTNSVILSNGNAYSSCKSNRSYETGLVYLDEDGRYSTIITNQLNSTNNCFIPILNSPTKNTLVLSIKNKAPNWATKYKIFVKDSKLEYQTIYGIIVYKDANYIWVKLEGQDKNKVKDGDYLIVKKNVNGVNQSLYKTEILEYKQQAPNFILTNNSDEISGNYIKLKNTGGVYDDVDVNANSVNFEGHSQSYNGPDSFRATINFWKFDSITSTYIDYPISSGSKIRIEVKNTTIASPDSRTFVKDYVAQNNYPNFRAWFQTEGNGLGDFTHYFFPYPSQLKVYNLLGGHYDNIIPWQSYPSYMNITVDILSSSGTVIFETDPKDKSSEVYYETPDTYLIDSSGNHLSNPLVIGDINQSTGVPAKLNLSFFNCYTQGNGAESYVVKDLFNANFLSTNTRPNAVELDGYKERREIASLTYSGSFDKTTSYNSLNEFNLSRANYKDLDDKYGKIQKLFSRDTDLIVFQEDKVHKVLFNKNLLSDAVGGGQITSVEQVLGQEVPFSGEWGIGTNPETFSNYANNIYFADQPKGVVLRLGPDGLEPISRYGMKDWFRDNLRDYSSKFVIGGYDPSYDNYILGFSDEAKEMQHLRIECNQNISNLVIPGNSMFSYDINIGNKVGEYIFNYDISGGSPLNFEFIIGMDTTSYSEIDGRGSLSITKENTIEELTVNIYNVETSESRISLSNVCPRTNELEVITLVVNDSSEAGKSMRNQYSWVDSTYGYSGVSSNVDVFDSSGLTRFVSETGMQGDGPMPFNNSLVRASSFKISGEFTPCNKIGYLITDAGYDAAEILDNATYPTVIQDGDENYIEFTYDAGVGGKLYMVWDYIDVVSSSVTNILESIDLGGSFTINALDNVISPLGATIGLYYDNVIGGITHDGSYYTYIHGGVDYTSDFFTYRVSYGDCYIDVRVDIVIREVPPADIPCYSYTINTDGYINSVGYIDCSGVEQSTSIDGTAGFDSKTFCARQLIGLYSNVVKNGLCD